MSDKRETILTQIEAICAALGVANGYAVYRNAPDISSMRPAINIVDGEEEANPSDPNKFGPTSLRRVHMQPEIIILADAELENEIGTSLNAIRRKVIYAILNDSILLGLSMNKSVGYVGLSQYAENGVHIHGAMALTFHVIYHLKAADLAP